MLNQIFETAKVVFTASLRKNLIIASLLIMAPLLFSAWLFETSNPGFQTGFILDAGSGLMSLLAIIVIAILGFDQLFWVCEQPTPWFYFSRLKSRILFPIGKFLGISFVLGIILLAFSFLLSLLIYFTSGSLILLPFKIAFIVWSEYSLLLSVLILFSTFLSKLMAVGMMITVYFIAQSSAFLLNSLPKWFAEILLTVLPSANLFEAAIESDQLTVLLFVFLYALFMSAFYITLAGWVLKRKDL